MAEGEVAAYRREVAAAVVVLRSAVAEPRAVAARCRAAAANLLPGVVEFPGPSLQFPPGRAAANLV